MTSEAPAQEQIQSRCPECGNSLPVHKDFVTWCPGCSWNLDPAAIPVAEGNALQRLRRSLTVRRAHALFDAVAAHGADRPPIDRTRLLSLAFAALIHLVTVGLVVLGVVVLTKWWPSPFAMVAGLALLAGGWLMRPRLGRLPRDAQELMRDEAPTLYGLLDQAAAAVGARPIDRVYIDGDYNASFAVLGLRRERVLTLGFPLWASLDAQQQMALVGHEIAHSVNGDSRRGLFLGGAIVALEEWYRLLSQSSTPHPAADGTPISFVASLGDTVAKVIFWPFAWVVLGLLWWYERLSLHSSQQAEYYADLLAAKVGSTRATLGLLDVMLLQGTAEAALTRWALRREKTSLADAIRQRIGEVPATEVERLRRISRQADFQVDSTHPPTQLRRDFLLARPAQTASVVLDPAALALVDQELHRAITRVERDLRDAVITG